MIKYAIWKKIYNEFLNMCNINIVYVYVQFVTNISFI